MGFQHEQLTGFTRLLELPRSVFMIIGFAVVLSMCLAMACAAWPMV